MRGIIIAVSVVVVVAVGALFISHPWSKDSAAGKTTAQEGFAAIQQEVAQGAKLYDVRTAEEFAAGHFAGATNWPVGDLQMQKLPDIAKTTKIYVYCRSGVRAGQATQILQAAGFSDVKNLGGLADIQTMGGQLE